MCVKKICVQIIIHISFWLCSLPFRQCDMPVPFIVCTYKVCVYAKSSYCSFTLYASTSSIKCETMLRRRQQWQWRRTTSANSYLRRIPWFRRAKLWQSKHKIMRAEPRMMNMRRIYYTIWICTWKSPVNSMWWERMCVCVCGWAFI